MLLSQSSSSATHGHSPRRSVAILGNSVRPNSGIRHAASRHLGRAGVERRRFLQDLLLLSGPVGLASSLTPGQASAALVEEAQPRVSDVSTPSSTAVTPTHVKATGRIVAIGDLHGDWAKAVGSLRAANVIRIEGDNIYWTGGDTVVVQLGDVLDRGDHEIAIITMLRNVHAQAVKEGGAVYMLNGNHESLNICGDFRYVTPGAFMESAIYAGVEEDRLSNWDVLARVRYAVYRPGGPMAKELAKNPTVLIVNDTCFVHGGLLPVHVNYGLERLNEEVSAWMRGENKVDGGKALPPFLAMGDSNSVMWNRTLSKEKWPSPSDRYSACRALQQALAKVGAARLVVGHTPQLSGANCECDGQVWRMDVGMSYGVLNRPVQVLEIAKDADSGAEIVRVLSDSPMTATIDEEAEVMI